MIYIIAGLPGAGKTYLAVSMALDRWKKDPNHKIFSNFPIRWKNCSSYVWKPEYVSEDIFDSTVIIDEAYRDYNSRDFKNFSEDSHLAFATSRHNGMDFIFIAQSVQRIDTVIREIANEIFLVHKRAVPFWDRPLWFLVESFDGVEMLKMRAVSPNAVMRKFRKRFHKEVSQAYDTLQYRTQSDDHFSGELWYPECIPKNSEQRGITGSISVLLSRILSRVRTHPVRSYLNELKHHWSNRVRIVPGNLLSVVLRKVFRSKSRPDRQRKREYDLFEPRGVVREIIFRNWMLWKPIFQKIGLQS